MGKLNDAASKAATHTLVRNSSTKPITYSYLSRGLSLAAGAEAYIPGDLLAALSVQAYNGDRRNLDALITDMINGDLVIVSQPTGVPGGPGGYQGGEVDLREVPVASATVIAAGDLVYVASGLAKPAAALAWTTNLATTQAAFADAFIGVAWSSSANGDTTPIFVDVSPQSLYNVAVPSGTFAIGDKLGPDEDPATKLSNSKLETAVAASAIAIAQETHTANTTTLLVSFASAVNPASSNVNAAVG